jgi:hypothetical protein
MNEDRDLNRLLDAWFADGPVQVADRVVDGMADRIARQRQLPAWRLHSWRFPTMSTPLKLVAIGAALLAVLLGGAVFIGGAARPTATPPPTAAPTPSPIALTADARGPGTFAGAPFDGKDLTWTVTIPDGWQGYDTFAVLREDTAGDDGVSIAIDESLKAPVDSCAAVGTKPAASAAEFVAAVQARADWIVSDPVDDAIGGVPVTRIDFELPADVTVCGGTRENYMVLANETGGTWWAQGPSNRWSVWIFDIAGRPMYALRSSFEGTEPKAMTQSDAIVDSIVITP